MSCHDIGRALNYVQEEIIEQYENKKFDVHTAKTLLIRCAEAINYCDGNLNEATSSFDKCYCSDCMCKVQEQQKLFTLYIGYPWYDPIDDYVEEHDLVGTKLCEPCFDKMFTAIGLSPEEIKKEKERQRKRPD